MQAVQIMNRLNTNALHSQEGGSEIFIEDLRDPDGRWYRVEYRCQTDGTRANAWLLHNPWGSNPFSYEDSHLGSDGFVCVARGADHNNSPFNLEYVVKRTRFWCTGYSFMREHGVARTRELIPEWG